MVITVSKRVAVYVRVSTKDQNTDGQTAVIRQWLESNGIYNAEWYIDHGYTRDTFERPEWQRLQNDIFHGRVGTVVCYKLDRLSGKMVDGITALQQWLDAGLRFVSVTQQFDFSGTVGKIVASLLFGLSEMEQETRRERQRAGIEAAKEQGVYTGGKPGRRKRKNGPRRAAELRGKGLSLAEIATALSVSRRTAIRYLKEATA